MIADALRLSAANACLLLAGIGALRVLARRPAATQLHHSLGLAYMTGVAAVGVLMCLLLVLGASASRAQFLLVSGGLFLAGFAVRCPRAPRSPLEPAPIRRLVRVLAAATVAFLVLLAVDLAHQPLWPEDAWAHWTPAAKAIVLHDGLDPRFFASLPNGDYPLLVPVLEALDFRFMGFDTRVVHLQFGFLVAGFLLALVDLLRDRVPPLVLWATVATVALAPSLSVQAAYAIGDVPLAVLFALAGVCAWRWLESADRAALGLLSLFSAATLATKVEGQLYVGALFLVLVPLVVRDSVRRAAATLAAGLVALVGLLPWRIWAATHDLENYYGEAAGLSLGARIDRGATAALHLAGDILDPTSWLLLVPLALAAAALSSVYGRRTGAVLFAATGAVVFAGFVWIYANTPVDLQWHLATSTRRVITGLVLFSGALAPLLLTHALEGRGASWRALAPTSRRSFEADRDEGR